MFGMFIIYNAKFILNNMINYVIVSWYEIVNILQNDNLEKWDIIIKKVACKEYASHLDFANDMRHIAR